MRKVTRIHPQYNSVEEKKGLADQLTDSVSRLEDGIQTLEKKLEEIAERFEAEVERIQQNRKSGPFLDDVFRTIAKFMDAADIRQIFQGEDVDEFGLDASFEERIRPFFEYFFEKYWRVEVKGIKNVPADGRVLLVANHSGTLPYDAMMIKLAVKKKQAAHRDVRFLVEDFVYHFPFLGTSMYRIGGVRACPENATRLLEKDQALVCFPEGVKGLGKLYNERYRLQRFGRGGFARICMKTKTPIVPVAVVGAEEIHPILYRIGWFARAIGVPYIPITPTFPLFGPMGLVPLPTKWTIEFGEPISFDNYTPSQIDDPILVNRVAEQVRQKIQTMIAEMLKKRISIW